MMKWILPLFAVVALISCEFSVNTGEGTTVKFCESVDGSECEGEADEFDNGDIYVLLRSEKKFDTKTIKVELFDITEESTFIDDFEMEIEKESNYFYKELDLVPGTYEVVFRNDKGDRMSEGRVVIEGKRTPLAQVIFGEDVDEQGRVIAKNDKFQVGEFAFAIKSKRPFNTSQLQITMYGSENGDLEQVVDRKTLDVSPEWNYFSYPITFSKPGMYRVEVTVKGKVLANGSVEITE